MKRMIVSVITAAILPLVGFGAAEDEAFVLYNQEDASAAIRIHNGYKQPVTFVWLTAGSNANNRVEVKESNGSKTTNLVSTLASTNTISELVTAMASISNAAGEKLLTIDANCSLSDDEFSTRVLTETNTIQAGAWGRAATWDTSVALHYNVYLPGKIEESGGQESRKVVRNWYGLPGGYGDVTLNIYHDGVEKYASTIRSPVWLISNTNTAAAGGDYASNNVVVLDQMINWPCPRRTDVLFRATRASTATTGGLGIRVEPAE